MPQSAEIDLAYPSSWEEAYRENGTVSVWHAKFPDLFLSCGHSTRLGTLDLFPQYTLMYLLRKQLGVMSATWYSLADTSKNSKNRERTLAAWAIMRQWMGEATFDVLRSALLAAGFSGFTGEPDLFCWHAETGKWFFAEAKGSDKLTESQRKWFQVCRSALGDSADIRVYRLRPKEHKTPNQAMEDIGA